jgi:hypothetical protein
MDIVYWVIGTVVVKYAFDVLEVDTTGEEIGTY